MLEFATQKQREIYQVELSGALNGRTYSDFKDFCDEILSKGYRYILFDCEKLGYVSSAGISALLYVGKRVQSQSGRAFLCSVNSEVKSILEFLGIGNLFAYAQDTNSAVNELKAAGLGSAPTTSGLKEPAGADPVGEGGNEPFPDAVQQGASKSKPEKQKADLPKTERGKKAGNLSIFPEGQSQPPTNLDSDPEKDSDSTVTGSNKASDQIGSGKSNYDDWASEIGLPPDDGEGDQLTQTSLGKDFSQEKPDASQEFGLPEPGIGESDSEFVTISSAADASSKKVIEDNFQDFYIRCKNCATMLRIVRYGRHFCPDCKKEFVVDENKNYRF